MNRIKNPLTPFGERVMRGLAGRSIRWLCDQTGTDQPTMSRLLRSVVTPDYRRSVKIARVLGVSEQWLIEGAGVMLPSAGISTGIPIELARLLGDPDLTSKWRPTPDEILSLAQLQPIIDHFPTPFTADIELYTDLLRGMRRSIEKDRSE